MALSQRQVLRQSQTIVMTPRLQQAIKLLQLPHLELAEYVQQEIEDNPLLERQDVDPDNVMDSAEPEDPQPSPRNEDGGDSSMSAQDHLPAQDQGPLDVDYDQLYAEDGRSEGPGLAMAAATGGGQSYGDPGRDLEQTLASATNLRDHLLEQLTLAVVDPVDRLIGVHLIDMLDEAGYLTGPLAQIAEQIGCDIARVEAALTVVQQFDPVGIGARDLAECLSLQLRERDRLDPAMQACLAHLDLIAAGDIEGLCEVCGVDAEDVGDMIEEIRALAAPSPDWLLAATSSNRRFLTFSSARGLAVDGWSSSTATRCRAFSLTTAITRRFAARPAAGPKRPTLRIGSTRPTGWSRPWINGPTPYCASPPSSWTNSTVSYCMAWSTCVPLIFATSRPRSRCTRAP